MAAEEEEGVDDGSRGDVREEALGSSSFQNEPHRSSPALVLRTSWWEKQIITERAGTLSGFPLCPLS